jgi:hypothetical protein
VSENFERDDFRTPLFRELVIFYIHSKHTPRWLTAVSQACVRRVVAYV